MNYAEQEKESVCNVNGVDVVSLYGTWHQMGCQYGRLCAEKMTDVLDYIDLRLDGRQERIDSVAVTAEKLYLSSPDYIKDFFDGVSETSGISLDRVKLCNALEYAERYYCSFMAVWDSYSCGELVAGRNYDAFYFSEIDKDIIVTVYHPEGCRSVATVGYAGEIYCVNGFNEKGFFVELNNGMPSVDWDVHWELRASTSSLLDLLLKVENMADVEEFFSVTQSFAAFIIGVCNRDEARIYEWCRDGVKRGDGDSRGLAVSTNHYVNEEWDYPVPSDESSWNSISRRANLIGLANAHKGNIDVTEMEEIMSVPLEDGGPFHELTRYQIVAVPADFMLYIHVPTVGKWSEIDLKNFF